MQQKQPFLDDTMTDPITLTAGAIATLAFTKFLESAAGEAGKKLTEATLEKNGYSATGDHNLICGQSV